MMSEYGKKYSGLKKIRTNSLPNCSLGYHPPESLLPEAVDELLNVKIISWTAAHLVIPESDVTDVIALAAAGVNSAGGMNDLEATDRAASPVTSGLMFFNPPQSLQWRRTSWMADIFSLLSSLKPADSKASKM